LTEGLEPDAIDVSPKEITITWDDGRVSRYDASEVRLACPCAECRGRRERGMAVAEPGATTTGAELVGNWGMSITFSDGHGTGIYTWDLLRAWETDDS